MTGAVERLTQFNMLVQAVNLLNEFHNLDYNACAKLFGTYAACNADVANHPTIQCGQRPAKLRRAGGHVVPAPEYEVGLVGLLNGLFCDPGPEPAYALGAISADNGHLLTGFAVLVRGQDAGELRPGSRQELEALAKQLERDVENEMGKLDD